MEFLSHEAAHYFVISLLTGSKSSTFEQADKDKQYQRTISAPGHHGDRGQPEPTSETSLGQTVQLLDDGFTVTDIDRTFDGHREHITATQVSLLLNTC